MDESRKNDLEEVMKQEKQRGRRPIDFEARKKGAQQLKDARKLLQTATEEEFVAAMRAAGLRDGSHEFLEALRIWRDYRS
jgi:hypothetical protein